MVAEQETTEPAEQLIADSAAKKGIGPGVLTLHANRRSSMPFSPWPPKGLSNSKN
jgi:hypothetical protein